MRVHTLTTVLAGLALALAGCADDATTDTASDARPSASAASATAPSTKATTAAPDAKCEPFPAELAAGLVTDEATGKTRVEGPIGEAVAVKSNNPRPDGKTTYAIAIDVGGKAVVLSHVVPAQEGPEAAGPFSPTNPFSVKATGLETDRSAQIGVKQAIKTARDCVV